MSKSRKGHSGPKRPERTYPTVEPVVTPYAAHLNADTRLDAMEEASRRAIAAGNPNYRVVKAVKKTSSILPVGAAGLLLGPDGKPLGAK